MPVVSNRIVVIIMRAAHCVTNEQIQISIFCLNRWVGLIYAMRKTETAAPYDTKKIQ